MKTGIKEIDELWKNQGQGELIVIGADDCDNWYLNRVLLPYIIYNTTSEIDVRNQSKIPHYKRILRKTLECDDLTAKEQKEAKSGLDYAVIIGNFQSLRHECVPYFPFHDEYLRNRYIKMLDLFHELPTIYIEAENEAQKKDYSFTYFEKEYLNEISRRTLDNFPAGIGAVFADFGAHGYKYAKVLQELAKTKNIPVYLVVPYHADGDNENVFKGMKNAGELRRYADKFILATSGKKMLKYFLYDSHQKSSCNFINNSYDVFIKEAFGKANILDGTPREILHKMVRNPDYCNKQNFSKYMKLSREENKKFWNYIWVFERCDMDELCEHIAAYKKDADSQELTLATLVLYRTVLGYFFDGDSHFQNEICSIMISPKDAVATDSPASAALDKQNKAD